MFFILFIGYLWNTLTDRFVLKDITLFNTVFRDSFYIFFLHVNLSSFKRVTFVSISISFIPNAIIVIIVLCYLLMHLFISGRLECLALLLGPGGVASVQGSIPGAAEMLHFAFLSLVIERLGVGVFVREVCMCVCAAV